MFAFKHTFNTEIESVLVFSVFSSVVCCPILPFLFSYQTLFPFPFLSHLLPPPRLSFLFALPFLSSICLLSVSFPLLSLLVLFVLFPILFPLILPHFLLPLPFHFLYFLSLPLPFCFFSHFSSNLFTLLFPLLSCPSPLYPLFFTCLYIFSLSFTFFHLFALSLVSSLFSFHLISPFSLPLSSLLMFSSPLFFAFPYLLSFLLPSFTLSLPLLLLLSFHLLCFFIPISSFPNHSFTYVLYLLYPHHSFYFSCFPPFFFYSLHFIHHLSFRFALLSPLLCFLPLLSSRLIISSIVSLPYYPRSAPLSYSLHHQSDPSAGTAGANIAKHKRNALIGCC